MLKILLIVLVLLGFAWSYPPSRNRMTGALEPVLVRLGPLGDMAAQPVRRYATGSELDFIMEQIELARAEGHEIPAPKTFQDWLRRRVSTKRNGRDSWNQPYWMRHDEGILTVGSNGQDGQRNTGDDITRSKPF